MFWSPRWWERRPRSSAMRKSKVCIYILFWGVNVLVCISLCMAKIWICLSCKIGHFNWLFKIKVPLGMLSYRTTRSVNVLNHWREAKSCLLHIFDWLECFRIMIVLVHSLFICGSFYRFNRNLMVVVGLFSELATLAVILDPEVWQCYRRNLRWFTSTAHIAPLCLLDSVRQNQLIFPIKNK